MTATVSYECDRCGREADDAVTLNCLAHKIRVASPHWQLELCHPCAVEFRRWANQEPRAELIDVEYIAP